MGSYSLADFSRLNSLQGVYMANRRPLLPSGKRGGTQTMITFDNGG